MKGPCEIADLKRRLTGTSRPHEKGDGHKRLQDGVSEDERWSLIKMVNLQVNRLQDGCSGYEMRAAWATSSECSNGNSEKQRDELAAAVHGKTGCPAQELNHVNLVQELLTLRETASRVNVAHHMWRHSDCLIFPRPAGANSKRNVCSALRVDKARRVKEGSSNRRTAGAPRMNQCRFEQRERGKWGV